MKQASGRKLNGVQAGAENSTRFATWLKERQTANDWRSYFIKGKLNRSKVCKECNFCRDVFRWNTEIILVTEGLEKDCREGKLFGVSGSPAPEPPAEPAVAPGGMSPETEALIERLYRSIASKDQRIKGLEERLAAKRAENADLAERIRKLNFIDEHLAATGRLLRS